MDHASYCVSKIENKKIYLNPASIIPTEAGFLLDLNGTDYLPISTIHSSPKGCFVNSYDSIVFCKNCGTPYILGFRCPKCYPGF
jgi:hypothetical protein